ncbi:MAG: class I SAM-dependent methyltransferase, partial [Nitrospirae bacterium]
NYIDNATNQFIKQFFEVEELLNEKDIAAETVYARLRRVFNEFIDRAELFETGISNKELIEKCRKRFHQKTNPIFLKSYSFTRTRVWPKGYHGDYKTLEGIYKNTPLSDGIGYYMDLYALNLTLARGVQNRLRILTDILSQELEKRQNPKILNIACGSCRELMELLPLIKSSKARITCIDTDEDALSFAYNRLSSASNITNHIDFRYYNALRFFDYEILERDFSKQDIIYSVGLFDYLQTDTLVKILRNLYNHLNPKGTLIAAFKDVRQYRPQPYHWFMDWTGFLQRKEEDFLEILKEAGIPDGEVRQSRDDTKSIIFYVITRV